MGGHKVSGSVGAAARDYSLGGRHYLASCYVRRLAPFLALPSRRNEVGTFPDASIDGTLPLDYDSRTKCMTLTYPAGKIARSGMTARLRLCKPETATEAVWSAWTDALVRLSRARARAPRSGL